MKEHVYSPLAVAIARGDGESVTEHFRREVRRDLRAFERKLLGGDGTSAQPVVQVQIIVVGGWAPGISRN